MTRDNGTDEKFTKLLTDHILNAKGFLDYGIEHGLTTPEDMRLTFAKRRETARALVEGGMSQTEAARLLGVNKSTISRDIVADCNNTVAGRNNTNGAMTTERHRPSRVDDLRSLAASGEKFGTIYADPPWLYDNQGTRASTHNHYDGLTVEQLCELPVRELAADDSHLHLWTTNGFLFDCPRIFEAWGFEFKSSFVWIKPQIGIGNYWRNAHEILLTAVRGDAKKFSDKTLRSWVQCDRGRHSAKPEQVRSYIEKASPSPYLELFGRREAHGWTVWGDEIENGLFDAAAIADEAAQ